MRQRLRVMGSCRDISLRRRRRAASRARAKIPYARHAMLRSLLFRWEERLHCYAAVMRRFTMLMIR